MSGVSAQIIPENRVAYGKSQKHNSGADTGSSAAICVTFALETH